MLKKTRQFIINHWVLITIILFIIYLIYSGQLLAVWRSIIAGTIGLLKGLIFVAVIVAIISGIVFIINKNKEEIKKKETEEEREKRALSQKGLDVDSPTLRLWEELADKKNKNDKPED